MQSMQKCEIHLTCIEKIKMILKVVRGWSVQKNIIDDLTLGTTILAFSIMFMYFWVKDTLPVSFRSELFTSDILPYLCSETNSCKYEKLSNMIIHDVKILQKNRIC